MAEAGPDVKQQQPQQAQHRLSTAIEQTPQSGDRLPGVDELVMQRYRVTKVIGDGGYGTVLAVFDENTKKSYAIKTEKYSRSMLHIEVHVLRTARDRNCKHFAELIDQGSVRKEYVFVVMTLMGRDLHKLRNDQPHRHFSPATAVRVAIQTLEALQELHSCSWISRDVKPGNFVIGLAENQTTCYLIDFGLARRYISSSGTIYKSRGEVGWRGTARYGSLQAHMRRDLGRKDDIESWLYMSIELWKGALPWRHLVERTAIQAMKIECRTTKRYQMFADCPKQYTTMLTEIDTWGFEDEPKYELFYKTLSDIARNIGIDGQSRYIPYDWEDEHNAAGNNSQSDKAQQRIGGGSHEPVEEHEGR
uniref:Protein kinase domain-containing protein n=1 Tax=Panagrellus redivivus TaxID=6233 RepID=A0A7E4WCP1_PANRE